MNTTATVGSLNLMTLGIVLIVLVATLLWFLRKRSNRHPLGKDEGITSNLDAAAHDNADPPRARDVRL